MKMQIFRLDRDDDILSAIDQLGWCKAQRVAIVTPEQKPPRFTLVDFVLLARETARRGAQAAFIVRDADLRARATRLGLLCFESLPQANRAKWPAGTRANLTDVLRRPVRRKDLGELRKTRVEKALKKDLPGDMRIALMIFVLLAMLAPAGLLIPRAKITFDAERQKQQYSFALQGDAGRETTPLSGIICAYPLTFTLEAQYVVKTSGQVTLGDGYAAGIVNLYNLTNEDISLPEGLLLTAHADGLSAQFETRQAVNLPGGQAAPQAVSLRALEPGVAFNLPSRVNWAAPGDLGLSIRVENPVPLNGGSDITLPAVSAQDMQNARTALLAQIDASARETAWLQTPEGQLLVKDSLIRDEILSSRLTPELGTPAQEAMLTLQVRYAAWVLRQDELKGLAGAMLDTLLPEGFAAANGASEIVFSGDLQRTENGFIQNVQLARTIERAFPPEQVTSLLLGQEIGLAGNILSRHFHLDQAPQIDVSPRLWPLLPFFRFQYEIIQP
jgi:hypothetical protein